MNTLSRRAALAVALSAAAASAPIVFAATKPATFVLVHGAWHGGWCWRRVAARLRSQGHQVFTPTLTGLGERRHLLSPQITLNTHIEDIVNTIEFEELDDVVLVGHSYAGLVIAGVADRIPKRLRNLVFLDALVYESGRSIFGDLGKDVMEQRLRSIRETGAGTAVAAAISPQAFGVTDPADAAWVGRRLTPQPVGAYTQPLLLEFPFGNGVRKTFIDCNVNPLPAIEGSKAKVRRDASWEVLALATGHDAMITAASELSDLLDRIATR